MPERERTHYNIGSYPPAEIGRVLDRVRLKGLGYQTIGGPRENFQLPDGSRVSIPEGHTGVVIITNDLGAIGRFWDGFEVPEEK